MLLLWVATTACFAVAWGVRPRPGDPGAPWPRWVLPTALLAAVLMLVAIPATAIYFSADKQPAQADGGIVLTPAEQRGKAAFASICSHCHALADARAAGTLGPDLDRLQPSHMTIVDAILNGRARGNGQMPRRLVDEAAAQDIADYITRVSGR